MSLRASLLKIVLKDQESNKIWTINDQKSLEVVIGNPQTVCQLSIQVHPISTPINDQFLSTTRFGECYFLFTFRIPHLLCMCTFCMSECVARYAHVSVSACVFPCVSVTFCVMVRGPYNNGKKLQKVFVIQLAIRAMNY